MNLGVILIDDATLVRIQNLLWDDIALLPIVIIKCLIYFSSLSPTFISLFLNEKVIL